MTRSARRGPWLPEEDRTLIQLVQTQGANNWVRISQQLQHRSPKQCRERYHQNLKPSLKHEPISVQEGERIEQMVGEIGKRWAEIARRLGNRSDNAVKNWWNGSMNRRRRNPTQITTGFKHVGSRLQPIHFTQADSNAYASQHRFENGTREAPPNRAEWSHHHHVDDSRSSHMPRLSIPNPLPVARSHFAGDQGVYLHDARDVHQLHQNRIMLDRPESTRHTMSQVEPVHNFRGLPSLRSDFHPERHQHHEAISSVPSLISPALSESSQSISLRHAPPSLISDNHSTISISPKTITSPKPILPSPLDFGSISATNACSHEESWPYQKPRPYHHHHHRHQSNHPQYDTSLQQRPEQIHQPPLPLDPFPLRKSHEALSSVVKPKDSRMHLSSLLD